METERQQGLEHPRVPRQDVDEQFVEKILEKSREGKVSWDRTRSSYKGLTSDGVLTVELSLVDVPVWGRTWTSFIVRRLGEELLRLESGSLSLAGLAGITGGPSSQRVSELFIYLEANRRKEVAAAMTELDQL